MGMVLGKKGEVPAGLLIKGKVLNLYRGRARFSHCLFRKWSWRFHHIYFIEGEVDGLALLLFDYVFLSKAMSWIDAERFKCRRNLLTQFMLVLE